MKWAAILVGCWIAASVLLGCAWAWRRGLQKRDDAIIHYAMQARDWESVATVARTICIWHLHHGHDLTCDECYKIIRPHEMDNNVVVALDGNKAYVWCSEHTPGGADDAQPLPSPWENQ